MQVEESDAVPITIGDKIIAMYAIIDNVGAEINKYKQYTDTEEDDRTDEDKDEIDKYARLYGATRGYFIEIDKKTDSQALKEAFSYAWDASEDSDELKLQKTQGVTSCHYGGQQADSSETSPRLMFCTYGGISKYMGPRAYHIYNYIPLENSPLSSTKENRLDLLPVTLKLKKKCEWSEKAIKPLMDSWNGDKNYCVIYLTSDNMGNSVKTLERFPTTFKIDTVASKNTAVKFLIRLFLLVAEEPAITNPFWLACGNNERYGSFIQGATNKTSNELDKDPPNTSAKKVAEEFKNIIKEIPANATFTSQNYDIKEKLNEMIKGDWDLFLQKNSPNQNAASFSALNFLMVDYRTKENSFHELVKGANTDVPEHILIIKSSASNRCYFFVTPRRGHAKLYPSYITSILYETMVLVKNKILEEAQQALFKTTQAKKGKKKKKSVNLGKMTQSLKPAKNPETGD